LTPVIIFEQLTGNVWRGPDAGRRHVEFARIGLGVSDEFRNRLGRNRWIDNHDKGRADDARNRHDIANEIKIKILIKGRIDRIRWRGQKERIAVGRRTHHRFGADIASGTCSVLDDELLAEPLR
jgi:hypothetical protein